MTRERIRATRTDDGAAYDRYVEEHPAYAMIGASRVSSSPGTPLFGSDFLHQHFVTIRIKGAILRRGNERDWIHGTKEYIEVALSEAQWASFVAAMNVGDGVPCTLTFKEGEGLVPGIEYETNRREQFNVELGERLTHALKLLDDAAAKVEASKAGVREKKEAGEAIRQARQELTSNLPFLAQQFDEHAEVTIEKAKIEVAAYINSAIARAGLQALGAGEPEVRVLELPAGEEGS